jgi:hypothetical protein
MYSILQFALLYAVAVLLLLLLLLLLLQMHRRMKGDAEWESVTRKVNGEQLYCGR